jgi:hypothetical protein
MKVDGASLKFYAAATVAVRARLTGSLAMTA